MESSSDAPLRVEGLVKKYGAVTAVDGVSFEVRRGSILCLLGLNGAGKTTTVEVAQGVRRPTAGTVRLLGVDPRNAPADVKRRVGVLPQRWVGFPTLTVREHVSYFAAVYGVRPDVARLLADHGLADVARRQLRTLSGGMRQRVGIVSAMVNDPEVLFLDEPTASVDPASRRRLWDLILRLREGGCSIVLTTHYMDEAERLADDVVVVHKGRLVARGTPEHVRREHGGGAVLRVAGLEGPLPDSIARRPGLKRDAEGGVTVPLLDASEGPLLVAELVKSGVSYREVAVRAPSLDDTFVRLVGEEGRA